MSALGMVDWGWNVLCLNDVGYVFGALEAREIFEWRPQLIETRCCDPRLGIRPAFDLIIGVT